MTTTTTTQPKTEHQKRQECARKLRTLAADATAQAPAFLRALANQIAQGRKFRPAVYEHHETALIYTPEALYMVLTQQGAASLKEALADRDEEHERAINRYREQLLANPAKKPYPIHYTSNDAVLWEMLEPHWTNGELESVRPEEIGALTDAPIFANWTEDNDQGELLKIGAVYWWECYCLYDMAEELLKAGYVAIQGAENNTPEEIYNG